jgi:hypothetical protein
VRILERALGPTSLNDGANPDVLRAGEILPSRPDSVGRLVVELACLPGRDRLEHGAKLANISIDQITIVIGHLHVGVNGQNG